MTRYLLTLLCLSCAPIDGTAGIPGPQGPPGPMGAMGAPGMSGGVSGSRIGIQFMTTPDGMRLAWGLYDGQRMEECSMQAIDGRYFCLPRSSVQALYFLDAACTERAVMVAAPMVEKYQSGRERNGAFRIYSLQAASPKPTHLYTGQPEACSKTAQLTDAQSVFRVEREISLSDFAEGTLDRP